jgi:hypothetical protein
MLCEKKKMLKVHQMFASQILAEMTGNLFFSLGPLKSAADEGFKSPQ